jgi:hypothetical protein
MDIGLWLGIASLVLAIPLGIATNLLTPRLIGYLERQNLIIAYRTKKQELAQYRRIVKWTPELGPGIGEVKV